MSNETRLLEDLTASKVHVWGPSTRTSPSPDKNWSITSLAAAGTRVGAQQDLGVLTTAGTGFIFLYQWWFWTTPNATMNADDIIELYLAMGDSEGSSDMEGDVGTADAALTDGAPQALNIRTYLAAVKGRGSTGKLRASGLVRITERYVAPVIVNGPVALSGTANDHLFKLKQRDIIKAT